MKKKNSIQQVIVLFISPQSYKLLDSVWQVYVHKLKAESGKDYRPSDLKKKNLFKQRNIYPLIHVTGPPPWPRPRVSSPVLVSQHQPGQGCHCPESGVRSLLSQTDTNTAFSVNFIHNPKILAVWGKCVCLCQALNYHIGHSITS